MAKKHYVVIAEALDAGNTEEINTGVVQAEDIRSAIKPINTMFAEYGNDDDPSYFSDRFMFNPGIHIIIEAETALRFEEETHPEYFFDNDNE